MSQIGANRLDDGFCTGFRPNIDKYIISITYIYLANSYPYLDGIICNMTINQAKCAEHNQYTIIQQN